MNPIFSVSAAKVSICVYYYALYWIDMIRPTSVDNVRFVCSKFEP